MTVGAAPTTLSRSALRRAVVFAISLAAATVLASSANAAPAPVSSATAASKSGVVRVVRPARVTEGDVLVATLTARAPRGASIGAPSGWKLVRRDTCAVNGRMPLTQALYVHVAPASEPAATSWTVRRATGIAAGVAAYRGIDTARPVQASAARLSRNSRRVPAPSVAHGADTLVAAFFGRSTARSMTAPTGTRRRYAAAAAAAPAGALAVDAVRSLAGSSGTMSAAAAAPVACGIGQSVSLRPASRTTSNEPPPGSPAPPSPGAPAPPGTPAPPPGTPPAGDSTAPSAPGNVRSTARTGTSVTIAWNAAADNVGVSGYALYRDGSFRGNTTARVPRSRRSPAGRRTHSQSRLTTLPATARPARP